MKLPKIVLVICVGIILSCSAVSAAVAPAPDITPLKPLTPRTVALRNDQTPVAPAIVFRHGNIDWLPELAAAAGWPEKTWARLGDIILRESGGCPTRIGGSIVAKDCTIIGWDGSNHRSDSGLTMINWVNYDSRRLGRPAFLCRELAICAQKPLLDPFLNLVAAKALYDVMGWSPWYIQP